MPADETTEQVEAALYLYIGIYTSSYLPADPPIVGLKACEIYLPRPLL